MDTKSKVVAALKALGYNSRMVSVSCKYSEIRATIRSTEVSYSKVESVLKQFESISRCEHSGEILSGGNTYTNVEVADSVREVWGATYLVELNEVKAEVDSLQPGTGISLPSGFIFWKDQYDYTISKNSSDFRSWANAHSLKDVAVSMFIYDEQQKAKTAGGPAPACLDSGSVSA